MLNAILIEKAAVIALMQIIVVSDQFLFKSGNKFNNIAICTIKTDTSIRMLLIKKKVSAKFLIIIM